MNNKYLKIEEQMEVPSNKANQQVNNFDFYGQNINPVSSDNFISR